MPRCDWCNHFAEHVQTVANGRTNLHLCVMCAAEQQLKEPGDLRVDDFVHRPTLWEKLRGYFRR